jgi:FkbM family methyltransferase
MVGQRQRFDLRNLRPRLSRGALISISRLHRVLGLVSGPARPDLVEARILTGDLRGHYLALRGTQVGAAMLLGTFERWVAETMRRHVRTGSVAYDVGASYGYHTLRLSRLVGSAGMVVALEPDPTDRAILLRNLRENAIDNVTVSSVALSSTNGQLDFATFSSPGVSHIARDDTPADAKIISVDVRQLDSLVYDDGYPPPDFIKIDVEGTELEVLRGARRALTESGPVVVCEIRKGDIWEQVMSLMQDCGYTSRVLHEYSVLGDVVFFRADAPGHRPAIPG